MRTYLRNNGLSITFFLLFIFGWVGQGLTGFADHNKELKEAGSSPLRFTEYLHSGHFIQATFENWESEFLQMALLVLLTISLKQKGSSESKAFEGTEEVDREPSASRKGAPWPVRKGGIVLTLYKHSLSLSLIILFLLSIVLHFYGSWKDENDHLMLKGQPLVDATTYLGESRFWFESFQNWQSEFLSVFSIIVLSIYLRQKGSPQSKPVDASHSETGE